GDDFVNAAEIVDAGNILDLVAAIAGFEGKVGEEVTDAGDGFSAAAVGDIDPFDRAWGFGEFENLFQPGESFLRIDVENFRLGVGVELAAAVGAFDEGDFVAQA